MRPIGLSVSFVCFSVITISPAKTAEPIMMKRGRLRTCLHMSTVRVVVSVSMSQSRYVSMSRLGLVSTKIFNVSVSSQSRKA